MNPDGHSVWRVMDEIPSTIPSLRDGAQRMSGGAVRIVVPIGRYVKLHRRYFTVMGVRMSAVASFDLWSVRVGIRTRTIPISLLDIGVLAMRTDR